MKITNIKKVMLVIATVLGMFLILTELNVDAVMLDEEALAASVSTSSSSASIWVNEYGGNRVTKFDGQLTPLFPAPLIVGQSPVSVAVDDLGNAYVVIIGKNEVLKLDPNGNQLWKFSSEETGYSLKSVALDNDRNAWVISSLRNVIYKVSSANGTLLGTYDCKGNLNEPIWIRTDVKNNIWVLSKANKKLIKVSNSGDLLGVFDLADIPSAFCLDPFNTVWVVYGSKAGSAGKIQKFRLDGILIFTKTLEELSNFNPSAIQVDGEGNVWVGNSAGFNILKLDREGEILGKYTLESKAEHIGITANAKICVLLSDMHKVVLLNSDGTLYREYNLGTDWIAIKNAGDFTGFEYAFNVKAHTDSDGDGIINLHEIVQSCDPFDANSIPSGIVESFENNFGDWRADHDNYEEEYYRIEIRNEQAFEGDYSVMLWMAGIHDDGTAWVERVITTEPNCEVEVNINFWLWSLEKSEYNWWYVVAYAGIEDPETEGDFINDFNPPIGVTKEVAGWKKYCYKTTVTTDNTGQLWLAMGISCVWEGAMTHYVDFVNFDTKIVQVNRPPVLSLIGDKKVDEGQLLQFSVNATDPDGDNLTYYVSGLPTGATFSEQTFTWRPDYTQAGNYRVTFYASDGILTDFETITITVNNVNQPPVLYPIGNKTVFAGSTLKFLVTATDPDIDPLKITTSQLPGGAIFRLYDGPHIPESTVYEFIWTPRSQQIGEYKITFTVTDERLTDNERIIIYVNSGTDKRITGRNRR